MSQIVERFEAAVAVLIADGPVKQRLASAYSEFLEDLQQLDLPVEGGSEFGNLHAALHRVRPVGKESCVQASVQKMSATEAGWHAQTILKLYGALIRAGRKSEPLTVVESAEAEAPRYLVGSH